MTPKEIKFCHDVCLTASEMRFGLKEQTRKTRHFFIWLLPGGETLTARPCTDRQQALLSACRQLGAHLAGL